MKKSKCPECKGKGEVSLPPAYPRFHNAYGKCHTCDGIGEININMKNKCEKCKKNKAVIQVLTHRVIETFEMDDDTNSGNAIETIDMPYETPLRLCEACGIEYCSSEKLTVTYEDGTPVPYEDAEWIRAYYKSNPPKK